MFYTVSPTGVKQNVVCKWGCNEGIDSEAGSVPQRSLRSSDYVTHSCATAGLQELQELAICFNIGFTSSQAGLEKAGHSQCSVEVVCDKRVCSCSHGEVAAACVHQDVELKNTSTVFFMQ